MDIQFDLYEIRPDGQSIFLTSDMMRARYRESTRKSKLVHPDEINLYELGSKYLIARKMTKNSRLRFIFSAVNSPAYQKNYNSGGDVSYETVEDAQKAIIKLFHDQKYSSNIRLPVFVQDLE